MSFLSFSFSHAEEALARQQEEAQLESIQLAANIAALKEEQAKQSERTLATRRQIGESLMAQIEENASLRAQQRQHELQEVERVRRAQAVVDERTQRALAMFRTS